MLTAWIPMLTRPAMLTSAAELEVRAASGDGEAWLLPPTAPGSGRRRLSAWFQVQEVGVDAGGLSICSRHDPVDGGLEVLAEVVERVSARSRTCCGWRSGTRSCP